MTAPWLQWIRRFLGIAPKDPADRVDAWLRELADQQQVLDNTLARLRAEARGAEHLLQQLDLHIASTDRDIEASLAQSDRTRASSLALERQQLIAKRPQREAELHKAEGDLAHLERVRGHFLTRQAAETRRLRELQRQAHTSELLAAVAEIDATIQTAPSHSYAASLLTEATSRADAERARLRVAADLAPATATGVHSSPVSEEPPSLIQSS
jgi:phage shock protein A